MTRTASKIRFSAKLSRPAATAKVGSWTAKWSSDSQQVTIVYRVDRHAPLKAVSYRIVGRRARRVKGPFDVKSDDLLRYWQSYGSGNARSPKIFGTPLKHD